MNYKVQITDDAKANANQAKKYYQTIIPGLEKRFIVDLKRCVLTIRMNPLTFGYRFEKFRTANLKIFPYQIHYIIDDENSTIIIIAILHAYRDPDFIRNRMNNRR